MTINGTCLIHDPFQLSKGWLIEQIVMIDPHTLFKHFHRPSAVVKHPIHIQEDYLDAHFSFSPNAVTDGKARIDSNMNTILSMAFSV